LRDFSLFTNRLQTNSVAQWSGMRFDNHARSAVAEHASTNRQQCNSPRRCGFTVAQHTRYTNWALWSTHTFLKRRVLHFKCHAALTLICYRRCRIANNKCKSLSSNTCRIINHLLASVVCRRLSASSVVFSRL